MALVSCTLTALLIFVIGVCVWIYRYVTRNFNYWKDRGVPFIKPIPFCGSIPEVITFRKSFASVFWDIYSKYDTPYVGLLVLDKPNLIIRDSGMIKSIIIEGFDNFRDRNVQKKSQHDIIGSHMLFFMSSPEWGIYRKKVSPVYTSYKMRAMYSLFEEVSAGLVDYLSKKCEESEILDFRDVTARYSTEIITSTTFGLKANAFSKDNSRFLKVGHEILNFTNIRRTFSISCCMLMPALADLLRIKFCDPESVAFLKYAFWKTAKEREETKLVRNDLVDILMQMKKDGILDDDDDPDGDKLLAQAVQFFLGGFETTATTIAFALYELARNQEIQTKLREEIKQGLEVHGKLSYDILQNGSLQYLDMVLKESLRKYPSVPYLDRKCNTDFQLPGTNLVIESGVGVYMSVMGLHRDPENFPDPEKFDPERFSPENVENIKPFSYLPFGDGPRMCPGYRFGLLSTKYSIVSTILNFELEFCKDTPEKIEFNQSASLTPVGGKLFLKFKKIKQ